MTKLREDNPVHGVYGTRDICGRPVAKRVSVGNVVDREVLCMFVVSSVGREVGSIGESGRRPIRLIGVSDRKIHTTQRDVDEKI